MSRGKRILSMVIPTSPAPSLTIDKPVLEIKTEPLDKNTDNTATLHETKIGLYLKINTYSQILTIQFLFL